VVMHPPEHAEDVVDVLARGDFSDLRVDGA
jgi:hypothetical protein